MFGDNLNNKNERINFSFLKKLMELKKRLIIIFFFISLFFLFLSIFFIDMSQFLFIETDWDLSLFEQGYLYFFPGSNKQNMLYAFIALLFLLISIIVILLFYIFGHKWLNLVILCFSYIPIRVLKSVLMDNYCYFDLGFLGGRKGLNFEEKMEIFDSLKSSIEVDYPNAYPYISHINFIDIYNQLCYCNTKVEVEEFLINYFGYFVPPPYGLEYLQFVLEFMSAFTSSDTVYHLIFIMIFLNFPFGDIFDPAYPAYNPSDYSSFFYIFFLYISFVILNSDFFWKRYWKFADSDEGHLDHWLAVELFDGHPPTSFKNVRASYRFDVLCEGVRHVTFPPESCMSPSIESEYGPLFYNDPIDSIDDVDFFISLII